MKNKSFALAVAAGLAGVLPVFAAQPPVALAVEAGQPGANINPAMWGIFFEDINFGADGGLYAELVKNRSFEFTNALMGWTKTGDAGSLEVREQEPFSPVQPHYLRIQADAPAAFGVVNEGFRGMGIQAGEEYDFSAQARALAGAPKLVVTLKGADGKALGQTTVAGFAAGWKKAAGTLKATATEPKARLEVTVEGGGTLDLDFISLFPKDTWKKRPGGMRADMVQLLADLKPGFLRFPGGCIVEGSQLDRRYQWKNTIGNVEERVAQINRWNYEFRHRLTPDYYQSYGLGFFEFFQLCEDIGAEPLPILNCGMACQFNTGQLVPMNELDPYIQDDLDLIEFANGPVTSPWGAKRAAMGHPEPFHLKMIGVGNEQWGQQYLDRYTAFARVLKEKHPEITLVSDAGPSPADDRFNFLWPRLIGLKADVVDQHSYARPIWFFNNTHRYDDYDRNGPKIFMGEYAAQSVTIVTPDNKNNLECALSEAAFMTGLERNGEVVRMASYAPLFAHIDAWQWTPNLIWTDNLRAYGTPNYYVQQMFTRNRGDKILPVKLDAGIVPVAQPSGGIGFGTFKTAAEIKDVKVTQGGQTLYASDFSTNSAGWRIPREGRWGVRDGAFRQRDTNANATVFFGEPTWREYTLALKARKLDGQEGFIIIVRNESFGTQVQWNLGGWGNQEFAIQSLLGVQDQVVTRMPGRIETDRWYDIEVKVAGAKVDCYLDGQLVQSATVPIPQPAGFYASAVRDEKAGEVIVKLVNGQSEARDVAVNLRGVKQVKSGAKSWLLTSDKLDAVNSFEAPQAVAPKETALDVKSATFTQSVPANSFMVLRVPAEF